MLYDILVSLLVILNCADVYTTLRGLESNKGITEANPVINWFLDVFGLQWGLALPKVVFFAFFFGFAYRSTTWTITTALLVVYYFIIVYRNYKILKAKGVSL